MNLPRTRTAQVFTFPCFVCLRVVVVSVDCPVIVSKEDWMRQLDDEDKNHIHEEHE